MEPTLLGWMKRRRDPAEAVLLDIDGVLTYGGHPIAGANKFLQYLATHSIPFFLVTNDGDHSPEEKVEILQQCNIDVSPSDIISCGHVIWHLVEENGYQNKLFFVLGSLGKPCYAQRAGLRVTRDVKEISLCDGIIIGEREYEWEPYINAVVNRCIEMPDIPIWVPNPDIYCPRKEGGIQITAGAVANFMTMILDTYGIKITPSYLGKPYLSVFEEAYRKLTEKNKFIRKENVLFVGDLLNGDILGAQQFGYMDVLALTGVTTISMLHESDITPRVVVKRLA